jgi:SAM-dependent methyltransferase
MALLPPEQAENVITNIRRMLDSNETAPERLDRLWKTLTLLEGSILALKLRNTIGDSVYSGPFKGMQLTPEILNDTFAPVLLGTYEQELHPAIEAMISKPFQTLLNIGCGYGYYSVGLARRMPQLEVFGFDTSEKEQQKSRDLAVLNHVSGRVHIAGEFKGQDFTQYADRKTLLIMDIEGAEEQLLDPAAFPALRNMDIIVELHDLLTADLSKTLTGRFAATHDIQTIRNQSFMFDLTKLVSGDVYIDPSANFVVTWERRDGPTPWAIMTAKRAP